MEIKRLAGNGMAGGHDLTTLIPVFGLNNLIMMVMLLVNKVETQYHLCVNC